MTVSKTCAKAQAGGGARGYAHVGSIHSLGLKGVSGPRALLRFWLALRHEASHLKQRGALLGLLIG